MGKSRIAIIDADSFVFAQASNSESRIAGDTPEEDLWVQTRSEAEAFRALKRQIEGLIEDSGCTDAILALTHRVKCFRYGILPTYKGNRVGIRTPILRGRLAEMLREEQDHWRVLQVEGFEADDVVGVSATSLQGAGLREPVVVSIDKDLQQIPGWNYDPGVGKNRRPVLQEITGKQADRHHLYQTLMGDFTDGYTGCPGVGTKKATKLLDDCAHLPADRQWEWVVEAFRKRGLDEEAALVQARVARILRAEDWDPINKEIKLWTPLKMGSPLKLASTAGIV